MAKFRIVIEAVQYKAGQTLDGDFERLMPPGSFRYCENGQLLIETLEGMMSAIPGDWVIRGVKGEFYPCKPDIFAATYERVDG